MPWRGEYLSFRVFENPAYIYNKSDHQYFVSGKVEGLRKIHIQNQISNLEALKKKDLRKQTQRKSKLYFQRIFKNLKKIKFCLIIQQVQINNYQYRMKNFYSFFVKDKKNTICLLKRKKKTEVERVYKSMASAYQKEVFFFFQFYLILCKILQFDYVLFLGQIINQIKIKESYILYNR
ncbi:unnamed protein product [Paramecium sonneborni]|uniref:Transmembrane protein n=1 Tax=Paramecium sonneborni TaxID=65129 RepID=A0A8S1L770_9CILI|nr:unnamed protein product [Paramecium sonneborni]